MNNYSTKKQQQQQFTTLTRRFSANDGNGDGEEMEKWNPIKYIYRNLPAQSFPLTCCYGGVYAIDE